MRPGYKQTEVGVIPEDWEVKPLKDVCWYQEGPGVRNTQFTSSGVKLLNGTNIFRGELDLESTARFISTKEAFGPYAHFLANEGDIVIASSGITIQRLHEKVAFVRAQDLPFCMNTSTIRFKPFEGSLRSGFLFHFLASDGFIRPIGGQATGSAQLNFGPSHVAKVEIALPPIPEQSAIATALGDVDALLAAQDALIAKKRAIKQGAMQELLTGKRRLPGFSGEWAVRSLGNFGACYRGVSYNPSTDLLFGDTHESVRLLRANNVQDSSIDLDGLQFVRNDRVAKHQCLQHDDVLICMANGSKDLVGKAARFTLDDGMRYTFGAFMGCYRPDPAKVLPVFAFYLFQTEAYRLHLANLLAGSSINNLAPKSIEGLEIAIPVREAEQAAIAGVLSDIDTELTALQAQRAKTAQLKQGMMQALLTGRIRLV